MNARAPKAVRAALLVDGRERALGPDETADLSFLTDLLADTSVWDAPSVELGDAVLDAVASAPVAPGRRRPQPRGRWIARAAAAAVLVVGIAVVATTGSGSSPGYAVQLNATSIQPSAHAAATITKTKAGFRITLDAHGMPALDSDQYYQAWLKSPTGTLVPDGTFSSSDHRITLWSGVSPASFPTLTVTIETVGTDQSSSGRRVLVGDVHAR